MALSIFTFIVYLLGLWADARGGELDLFFQLTVLFGILALLFHAARRQIFRYRDNNYHNHGPY